jgi:hypothetical protein
VTTYAVGHLYADVRSRRVVLIEVGNGADNATALDLRPRVATGDRRRQRAFVPDVPFALNYIGKGESGSISLRTMPHDTARHRRDVKRHFIVAFAQSIDRIIHFEYRIRWWLRCSKRIPARPSRSIGVLMFVKHREPLEASSLSPGAISRERRDVCDY